MDNNNTYQYQYLLLGYYLLELVMHLRLREEFVQVILPTRSELDLPPEDPPQDSNWFTGFNVRPMILFTVSPNYDKH